MCAECVEFYLYVYYFGLWECHSLERFLETWIVYFCVWFVTIYGSMVSRKKKMGILTFLLPNVTLFWNVCRVCWIMLYECNYLGLWVSLTRKIFGDTWIVYFSVCGGDFYYLWYLRICFLRTSDSSSLYLPFYYIGSCARKDTYWVFYASYGITDGKYI